MKGKKVNPHIDFITKVFPLELFLDHALLQKSQEDVEVANPEECIWFYVNSLTSLLLKHFAFSSSTKTSMQRVW